LIVACSPCIAHGYYPRLAVDGGQPFHLDSKPPRIPLEEYIYTEAHYRMLTQSDPAEARELLVLAQMDVRDRWARYEQLSRKDGSHDA